MTASATTYDAIKETIGDNVEVLHFDEAWYAYANFHEFYDGYHGILSADPSASRECNHLRHPLHDKLLAAWSQASMIHIRHGEKKKLDMARFNDSFMMHTSTSPQYGIIASCDVAAAMMEQPAGRALVQETIEEAPAFAAPWRRCASRSASPGGSTSGSRTRSPASRAETKADWVLKPGDKWHGFEGLAANHVLVDPIKVTILASRPVRERNHAAGWHPCCSRRQVPVVPAHRDREDRPLLVPGAVLDGRHQGQVEHACHRAPQLQGPLRRQRADLGVPCRRSTRRIRTPIKGMGLKDLCDQIHGIYRKDNVPKAQRDMYTVLPEMAMRPADAYERLVRGQVESVEIDHLDGPHAGRDGRALSARHSADHARREDHQGNQVDPRLPALCQGVRHANSPASRRISTACASSRRRPAVAISIDCIAKDERR